MSTGNGEVGQASFVRDPATRRIIGIRYYHQDIGFEKPSDVLTEADVAATQALVSGGGILTLAAAAREALNSNLRTRGVTASPPTVTANDGSLPAGQTKAYLRASLPTFFRENGGLWAPATANFTSAMIAAATVGRTYGRLRFLAYSEKVTVRVIASTVPYRFIVDGQYVDMAGTIPTTTSGTGTQYITLDFTSAGGRKLREIEVEIQQAQRFSGIYVGATETCHQADAASFRTASIGDSYCVGSSADNRGDGIDVVMSDYLGWDAHMTSGSGGTGWTTPSDGVTFNFVERINNGDLLLNGTPTAVTFQGSVNDRNSTAVAVTAACLAGLTSARAQLPGVPFFVFGVFPAPLSMTLSAADNEAAISAAVTAFADPLTYFIPIAGADGGPWLTGTGWVGATAGNGNGDTLMADNTHLNTLGCATFGRLKAEAIASVLRA